MPLVNTVLMPLALKDAFNSLSPSADLVFYTGGAGSAIGHLMQQSVEDPEVGALLCTLYTVPIPGDSNHDCHTEYTSGTPRSGRGDLFDFLLTGVKLAAPFTVHTKNGDISLPAGFNINRPANAAITAPISGVIPAEMLRLNTAIKGDTCAPTPSRLGLAGGDICGFPNGQRLTDDVFDITLLLNAGAFYATLDGRNAAFHFNPSLISTLKDSVDQNDVPFRVTFPYLALAQSGQAHSHLNATPTPTVTPIATTETPTFTPTPTPTLPPNNAGADTYEADDTCEQAKVILANGIAQDHSFHKVADNDWVRFDATAGVHYRIEVQTPGRISRGCRS